MAKKLYWLGKGQVKIDGKLYGKDTKNGRAFPTKNVDKDRLERWGAEGLVSEKPFEDGGEATTIDELNKKVKGLSEQIVELNKSDDKAKIKELGEKITELETKAKEHDDVVADFEADAKTAGEKITELEEKVKELTPKAE